MRYRTLGRTGLEVSAVSTGCWALSGTFGPVEEKTAIETVHTALDLGVNFFDTADVYGKGKSEEILGKALEGRRDKVYIATKVGHWQKHFGSGHPTDSAAEIIERCEDSLRRLRTDYVDLYQDHNQLAPAPEAYVEAFETLKEQGKIRHYGVSTDQLEGLKAINANDGCGVCQINYSILNRDAEAELFPYCIEHNIGVLLRGPIAQGLLADKFTAETVFADGVRAKKWNEGEAMRQDFLDSLKKVAALRSLVRDGRTMIQAALQFTLAQSAVTCPIPSMKSPEQARMNAGAADGDLTVEDLALIDQVCPGPNSER